MQEVRLTIRKRAFPSEGRVRFNVAHLPALGIQDGEKSISSMKKPKNPLQHQ